MAYYTFRANLTSATFPFYTSRQGRTVIVPQMDLNYDRQTAAAVQDTDKDKGIPQIYYCHNVLPTMQGFQSISYTEMVPLYGAGTAQDFDHVFTIQTPSLNRFLFCPAAGKNYIYSENNETWVSVSPITPGTLPQDVQVTTAFVQGETYICYANYGTYRYDDVTNTMIAVTLTGLVAANVLAICESNGYMIAITSSAVAWSSLLDPTDFTPSLTTGANGGSVGEAEGALQFCVTISGGFMIYCFGNVVSATYSGNVQYPFIFKQINGSAGVNSVEKTSWQANLAEHYAISSNGVQRLSRSEAVNLFPDLSDFLASKIYEIMDEATLTLSETRLTTNLYTQVVLVSTRFLVFSYGTSPGLFSLALVYDLTLKRFGKLKIDHTDCFQWNNPNKFGSLTYDELEGETYDSLYGTTYDELASGLDEVEQLKEVFCFLQADGTVWRVNFEELNSEANGFLLMGKYQLLRNNTVIHLATELETVQDDYEFKAYLVPSLDGKTLSAAVPMFLAKRSPAMRRYNLKYTAVNVSVLVTGAFSLVSKEMEVAKGGDR